MVRSKWIIAAAAMAMVSSSVLAATPAVSASGAQSVRAGSATEKKEKLGQGGILIAALVGAGAIAGFFAAAFNDNDPNTSP